MIPTDDVRRTAEYYAGAPGFRFAKHFDKGGTFATLYRGEIEIVVVQKRKGDEKSNTARYDNGFDAYFDIGTLAGLDAPHEEFRAKGGEDPRRPRASPITAAASERSRISTGGSRESG